MTTTSSTASGRLFDRREGVEEIDVRTDRAADALDLRALRLDAEVLVLGVGAAAVAHAEVHRRELERGFGEEVARPGAAAPRQDQRLEPGGAVDRELGAGADRVVRRGVRVVAPLVDDL